jgi:hypothetical protein
MVGAAAGGGRAATVAIVLRARDMASKVFERVAKSTGGLTGAFKGLGLGIMRLLGPLGSVALGFQILAPLIAGVTIGLTTRKWLQYRDAVGLVRFQLGMLGYSMGETNDMIRLVNSSLDKQSAISLYNNQKAVAQLSEVVDQDLLQGILNLSQEMTDALGPGQDWLVLLLDAHAGGDELQKTLGLVNDEAGKLPDFAESIGLIRDNLDEIEPSNVGKLADHWAEIEKTTTSMMGPLGDIIAAIAIPFVLALELALKGIDNVRLSLGFWLEPLGLIVKFFFNLLLAALGLMELADVFTELNSAFRKWKDQFFKDNRELVDKLTETFNSFLGIFETVLDGLLGSWEVLQEDLGVLWSVLGVVWDSLWEGLGITFQTFLDWIQPLWDGFLATLDGALGTLQAIGSVIPGLPAKGDRGLYELLPDWMGFQRGGIVPGPIGSPVPAIVHGGERIIPVGGGGGSGGTVIVPLSIGGNMLGELIVDIIHRTAKFESGVVPGAIGGGTSALR